MFGPKEARTAAFRGPEGVLDTECDTIAARRTNQGIANHADFAALSADLDIPQEQRSGTLVSLIDRLNDPEQTKRWQEHAARNPERSGIANLIGLALSGGGIRSATFNLGILQVLAWTRLLKYVDYLSTVSGGGYIGSCVSSMFASPLKAFPFEHKQGQVEGAVFRHLRNNAEYLAPGGAVDYLRIPLTVIRGMVINLLVILPYLLLAAILTAAIHPTGEALEKHWLVNQGGIVPAWMGTGFIVSKALLLLLLLTFFLFPIVYLIAQRFSMAALADWKLRDRLSKIYGSLILLIAIVAFVEFQPYAVEQLFKLHQSHDSKVSVISAWVTGIQAAIPAVISIWLMKNAEKLIAKHVFALIGLSAMIVFWILYLWMCVFMISDPNGGRFVAAAGLAIGLLLYGVVFVDMNYISVHAFYRDRLSKAYIVKQRTDDQNRTCIEPNDKQLLSKLNTAYAPYHLINTALNLKASDESYRKGRHADSFVFSRHFIGSDPTGYCKTSDMEAQLRHVNLATAMAISGAAASPNMGKQTNRLFAFFMSMLNVRLNYWMPNPRYVAHHAKDSVARSPLHRVGPLYLMRELFGWLNNKSINVNLSDGGHFENLGVYELLRRECRLIVCGDGEADPHLRFNGLAEALRMAQTDFGIIVKMEGLDAIRAGTQHHAVGKIRYSDNRVGYLLYLKQSLRGDDSLFASLDPTRFASSKHRDDDSHYDDNAYIAEYKSRMLDFPHQSTGDQFFDEAQFECTRAVGYDVAYRTLCRF